MELPHRIPRTVGPAVVAALIGITAPLGIAGAVADTATAPAPPLVDVVGPDGRPVVARHQASDMVVDWLEEPPVGADAWVEESHDEHLHIHTAAEERPGVQERPGDVTYTEAASASGSVETAAPGQGFAVFAEGVRLLPSGYTLRLAGDPRVEQYRDELTVVSARASATSGVPIRVAPGVGGTTSPGRGEIVVVVGDGPCGAEALGCGGPSLTGTEVLGGRVWIGAAGLTASPAIRLNLAAHEVGHALGLRHYADRWSDGVQVMHPQVVGVDPYREGDGRGLRYLAGAFDQAAGSLTESSYAAGRIEVAGTVTSGTKIRVGVGSATTDVTAHGGRFTAGLPAGAGTHRVCASSLDAAAGFRREFGCVDVVAPGDPFGRLESVSGSFETVLVSGWAVDPQTADPVQVEIRRNGEVVATVTADKDREDIGRAHVAYGAAHGFSTSVPAVPGDNTVCARVLGVGDGGSTDLGCQAVVHRVDPVGVWEVNAPSTLAVSVSGWALDPNTADPIVVQATVDGMVPPLPSRFRADDHRPDVAKQHPAHGAAHGFAHDLFLPAGEHELCLTAKNVGSGDDRSLGCARIKVGGPLGLEPSTAATSLGASLGDISRVVVGTVETATGVVGRAPLLREING